MENVKVVRLPKASEELLKPPAGLTGKITRPADLKMQRTPGDKQLKGGYRTK